VWTEGNWVLPTGKIDLAAIADETGHAPGALVQKIAILHDRMAIAFSGDLTHVPEIQSRMREALATRGVSLQTIAQAAPELLSGLSLIALFVDDEGRYARAKFGDVATRHVEGIEAAWAGGSGREHFFEAVRRVMSGAKATADPANLSLSVITDLIYAELVNRTASRRLYGGAYEVCVFHDGRFQKLDGLVSGIFQLSLYDDGYELFPPASLVHTRYHGDDLLVSATINHGGSSTLLSSYARPVAQMGAPLNLARSPEFDGRHYALRIDLLHEKQRLYHWIETHPFIEPGARPFSFLANAEDITVTWLERYEWLTTLLNDARTVLAKQRPELLIEGLASHPPER
jgi:hypothetical protein